MAKASKIGSAVYKSLPEDFRQFWMYRAFVGEALKMLKEGMTGQQVLESLFKTYAEVWYIKTEIKTEQKKAERSAGSIKRSKTPDIKIRWKQYNENRLYHFQAAVKTSTLKKSAGSHLSRSIGMGPPRVLLK